jgi:hypothetical protein
MLHHACSFLIGARGQEADRPGDPLARLDYRLALGDDWFMPVWSLGGG